jgi:hypothetical protein
MLDVFDMVPLTFVLDCDNLGYQFELEKFINYFNKFEAYMDREKQKEEESKMGFLNIKEETTPSPGLKKSR